ncbi:MAG: YdcF family protein [Clostridia bacterium]|nr:YdcF family protein [Clostridia bacterium]
MKRKILKRIAIVLVCLMVVGAIGLFSVNAYVKSVGGEHLITPEQAYGLTDVDCIIVLGCFVESDGTPCDMLRDRLTRGIELYKGGAAPKIIMSGDHGTVGYDEVNAMKQYAIDCGVPSSDIFMDHAGFSTYESVYRAKEIFAADKVIIVTQEYHLTRALYIAQQLGVEAYGVASDYHRYSGQTSRDIREILARNKDFAISIFKPEPTYLGDVIPVSGNGDSTND